MMSKFYKDLRNNEIVFLVDNVDNDNYEEIICNSSDGSLEKHIPVYEKNGDSIIVRVGEVNHPMIEEHYIMWVALVDGDNIIKKELAPFSEPNACFKYISGSKIYAYCNIHGLWNVDVK